MGRLFGYQFKTGRRQPQVFPSVMIQWRYKTLTAGTNAQTIGYNIRQMYQSGGYRLLGLTGVVMKKYIIFQHHRQLPLLQQMFDQVGVITAQIIIFLQVQQRICGSRTAQ